MISRPGFHRESLTSFSFDMMLEGVAAATTSCSSSLIVKENGFRGTSLREACEVSRQPRRRVTIVRAAAPSEGSKPVKPPVFVLNVKPERKPLPVVEDTKPLLSLENYDFENLVVDPNHRSGTYRPLHANLTFFFYQALTS